jgi:hypothetical protein
VKTTEPALPAGVVAAAVPATSIVEAKNTTANAPLRT